MKRLLTSTTALSLAFAPISPLPLAAQVAVETDQGSAICLTADDGPCPEGEVCFLAQGGDCAAEGIEAEADAALQASGGAPGLVTPDGSEAAAASPEAAPAEPPAEAAAPAAPEEAPAAETAAETPAEAAPSTEAPDASTAEVTAPDAPAPEAAEQAAPADAQGETVTQNAPAEAVPEPAPEPAPETAESAPETEATPTETAEDPAATAPDMAPDMAEDNETEAPTGDVTPEATTDAAPDTAAETPETAETMTPEVAPETGAAETAEGDAAPATTDATTDTAGAEAQDGAPILGEAATVLQDILGVTPDAQDGEAPAAAAATAAGDAAEGETAPAAADVSETEITEENTRSSDEEFTTTQTATAESGERRGMSDLERFGLAALGALAVGAVLKNGDRVLSNTGDRVVIEDDRGDVRVLKDDDTLLRRPGSRLQTETFSDGSTRSTLNRDDGSSIVTIRDATGRVLRRARYAPDGTELVLIDDLRPIERIDVATLPPPPAPREQTVISTSQDAGDLARALAEIEARDNARAYSLRQIRDYREVRALAPMIDVESITFRSGSAAIDVSEAEKLSQLGGLITDVLAERPYEIFLIEGHTDAVGSAASNLALSDRRAESLALALTEYFGIPPENLVVQGYGESELRIPTQAAEERNRRAAVRLISPLMRTAALR